MRNAVRAMKAHARICIQRNGKTCRGCRIVILLILFRTNILFIYGCVVNFDILLKKLKLLKFLTSVIKTLMYMYLNFMKSSQKEITTITFI